MDDKYHHKYRIKSYRMSNWDYSGLDIISFHSQTKIVNIILEKLYKTVDGASVILSKQRKKYGMILT